MSKKSSKKLFEWYALVAEKKLNEKYPHIQSFEDCKNQTEFNKLIRILTSIAEQNKLAELEKLA